jgi:hypothetical protein
VAAEGGPTLPEFVERLRSRAVTVRFALDQEGKPFGVSYRLGGRAIPGSKLGSEFSWRGLRGDLGVSYDRGRDRALVIERGLSTGRPVPQVSYSAAQDAVRAAVDRALGPPLVGQRRTDGPSLTLFLERLAEAKVKATVALDRAGKPFGISYEFEGRRVAARSLGGPMPGATGDAASPRRGPATGVSAPTAGPQDPGYTWRDLVLKRGLRVDPGRDAISLPGVGRTPIPLGCLAQTFVADAVPSPALVRALSSPRSMGRFAVAQVPGVGHVFWAAVTAEQIARNPLLTVALRVADKVLPPIPGLRALVRGLLSPEM